MMKARKQILQEYLKLQSEGLSKGNALSEVASSHGFGGSTIRHWERLFKEGGKRALIPRYQSRPSRSRIPFSVLQTIILFRRLLHWGGKRISMELASRGIYQISHEGVYQIFRRYRL